MKNLLLVVLFVLAAAGCGISYMLLRMPDHDVTAMIVDYLAVKPGKASAEETSRPAPQAAPDAAKPAAPVAEEQPAEPVAETQPEVKSEEVAKPVDPDEGKEWKGFRDENWYAGRKLSDKDFKNKVVLVYEWNSKDKPSVNMLKRIEEIWASFKHMPLVVVGSHRGGNNPKIPNACKKLGLTFSMYEGAGFGKEPVTSACPYFYVVNHHGRLVFRGSNDREATEAMVNAVTAAKLKQ